MLVLIGLLISTTIEFRFVKTENITSAISTCPAGHFLCLNATNICIHRSKNCDGQADCPLKEDEELCYDTLDALHWDNMFRKRPSAEDDYDDETCKLDYNGDCICRHRDLLCHDKNYTKAPDNIPREFIHLMDFTGNNFKFIGPITLENIPHHIIKLVLKHCKIEELLSEAFYNVPKMRKLYLDNNSLKYFPSDLFEPTNHLEMLLLGYNEISTIHPLAFEHLKGLIELDLSYNKLTDLDRNVLEPLTNLTQLSLRGNLLKSVRIDFFPNIPLAILSLMENQIEEVEVGSLAMLPTLLHLYLSYNKIKTLNNGTFHNLSNLLSLTLNNNNLMTIDTGVFLDVTTLKSLNFERNTFTVLDSNVLKPLNSLQNVYFERFEKCIAAPHVSVCYPKGDGISSYEHLLHNPILRASVWVMATVGCVGNIVALLGRLIIPTNNVIHSLYIKHLSFSDLLMGIYLFMIAGVDQHYRGVYLQHEYNWRHSFLCNICGFLSTLSYESSVLILSLVTWERFISVTQPLARKKPSRKTASITLICLWIITTIVAAVPLLDLRNEYFKDFYNGNGVCLALLIHDPFHEGWEYSTIMFVFVNTVVLIFISCAYARMIYEIRASNVTCRSTQQSKNRDKVAQRFGIIVLTDCICWVPVIIVKITALLGVHISECLYAWLAIFLLPINSALNPLLYTLTTKIFKKQIRKTINSYIPKRKRLCHQRYDSAYSGTQNSLATGTNKENGSKTPTAV